MLDLSGYYDQFDADVRDAVGHAYERAPGFRARMEAAQLAPERVGGADDLARLPVLQKDDLIHLQREYPPFGGLLAASGRLRRIFQSPGPIYDPESDLPDPWRWARALEAAGFQSGDVVMNAFGYHLTPAGAMFEEGLKALGCVAVPGGIGNQEQQVALLRHLHVTGYIGLPTYLKALLDKAAGEGPGVDGGLMLRRAFVTGEPLPPSLRRLLQDRGLTIRQGYGTAECGLLGYECEAEEGLHLPDSALVQVCDPTSGEPLAPGQVGQVVVTLFGDYALIRFGTGDLSSLQVDPCRCGRASPRLAGVLGRMGEGVKVRGMFFHPRQAEQVLARFAEVTAWQAVVTRIQHRDELTLRIATPIPPDQLDAREDLKNRLVEAIRDSLRFRSEISFVPADAIPLDARRIVDERTWE